MTAPLRAYLRTTRAPRYSLVFAFPLLVLYEILAAALSREAIAGVRNGADVLLKTLFVALGGRIGLVAFGLVLVGGGAVIAWRDRRRAGPLRGRYFLFMAAEAVGYALVFGLVAGALTAVLLRPMLAHPLERAVALPSPAARPGFGAELMVSLGAGIYEELLFRVLLVGALAWLGRRAFGWSGTGAGILAVVVGALVFSGFHYVGPYADRLELGSFAYRAVAGVLLSALYLLRGFGITAWTHALYDVFLILG